MNFLTGALLLALAKSIYYSVKWRPRMEKKELRRTSGYVILTLHRHEYRLIQMI